MKRSAFIKAYTASCMKSLAANDPGSPAEMACCEVQYREKALKVWRRLIPGVRQLTLPALEELLRSVEYDRKTAIKDDAWPWCAACRSYHHPANPTCFLLTRPQEKITA